MKIELNLTKEEALLLLQSIPAKLNPIHLALKSKVADAISHSMAYSASVQSEHDRDR